MKKILLSFIGILLTSVSLNADKVIVKVPLDIDAIPNNGYIRFPNGTYGYITHAHLRLKMIGCNDKRDFDKWIVLTDQGIHRIVTIEKTFATECGDPRPQVTVFLQLSSSSRDAGWSTETLGTRKSSLKPLIITNTNAVRGYFSKVE